jgi:Holliday junction resolvase
MSHRGHDRERDVAELLRGWGWLVVRAAGSLGVCDLVAIGGELARWEGGAPGPLQWSVPIVLLVEVKSTAKGPYERFCRAEREELIVIAAEHGATPLLAWWPPSPGKAKDAALQWRFEHQWPNPTRKASSVEDPAERI